MKTTLLQFSASLIVCGGSLGHQPKYHSIAIRIKDGALRLRIFKWRYGF